MLGKPIKCPRCDGRGELELLIGRPANIPSFSEEHEKFAEAELVRLGQLENEDLKLSRLGENTVFVTCPDCLGRKIVWVSPVDILKETL